MQFSARNRSVFRGALAEQTFDILVIGGGITGAGIALDASARGLSVALVEKKDFAFGTSSRSTKLIHGGLRYLKQLEVALVREVGQERAILHRNAPHIVVPEKMLLPIIKVGSLGKYPTSLGLYVYDRLAGVEKDERRVMLSKMDTLGAEPLLREDILLGGGLYIEYRTDDARLVTEVLKTAVTQGAMPLNYCEVTSFIYDNGKVAGVQCVDHIHGDTFSIKAKKVINAAGPWVDSLREMDKSLKGKRLHLTKGVHLVVNKDRLPLRQSVYFDVPDGRMVFAIPRSGSVYIGTTDTTYKGSIDTPLATERDIDYILSATNEMFPSACLTRDDVLSTWAGLRPLIHEDGKSPSDLSRKDEIFISPSGLISIAGGKLTGFRKMAERSVDVAVKDISTTDKRKFKPCTTDTILLSGGDCGDPHQFALALSREYPAIDAELVRALVLKYGSHTTHILDTHLAENMSLLEAEWKYCVDNEMAQSVGDVIIRRMGRLYFDRPWIAGHYTAIHEGICRYLGYDAATSDALLKEFLAEYEEVLAFSTQ